MRSLKSFQPVTRFFHIKRILEENSESRNLIENLKEENEKFFVNFYFFLTCLIKAYNIHTSKNLKNLIKRKEEEFEQKKGFALENQQNLLNQIQGLKNQEARLKG